MQHFGGMDSKSERELMASVRYDRINEEIKKALSEIVREMKDPRISPMTTIMLVEATNDLKLAKVRVSVYDKDDSVRKETVAQLNRAEGFIARELGRRIDIRRIPTLKFTPRKEFKELSDFEYEDFIIENYYPDPVIKFPLSVG